MYTDDLTKFTSMPSGEGKVMVYDVFAMSPVQVRAILDSPGTIIGGFCNSGVCLKNITNTISGVFRQESSDDRH